MLFALYYINDNNIYDFPRVNSREIRIDFYKRKINFAPPLGHNGTPPWGQNGFTGPYCPIRTLT